MVGPSLVRSPLLLRLAWPEGVVRRVCPVHSTACIHHPGSSRRLVEGGTPSNHPIHRGDLLAPAVRTTRQQDFRQTENACKKTWKLFGDRTQTTRCVSWVLQNVPDPAVGSMVCGGIGLGPQFDLIALPSIRRHISIRRLYLV